MYLHERSTEPGTRVTIRLGDDTKKDVALRFWRLYGVLLTICVAVYGVCFWGR